MLKPAVKSQAVADFIVQHCGPELNMVDLVPWTFSLMDLHVGMVLELVWC